MKPRFVGTLLVAIGLLCLPPLLPEVYPLFSNKAEAKSKRVLPLDPLPNFKIVINVPATELRFYEDGELIRRIPVAVGQARYPSPTKKVDKIERIVWNPWWHPPDSEWAKDAEITPPGPYNPLGVVKMPLSKAILLHGTDKPWSIGTPASHACIRMYNEDARSLAWTLQSHLTPYTDEALLEEYARQRSKTVNVNLARPIPVEFVYEPIEIEDGEVYLYRDLYWKIRDKRKALLDRLLEAGYPIDYIRMEKLEEVIGEWKKGTNKIAFSLRDLVRKSI